MLAVHAIVCWKMCLLLLQSDMLCYERQAGDEMDGREASVLCSRVGDLPHPLSPRQAMVAHP